MHLSDRPPRKVFSQTPYKWGLERSVIISHLSASIISLLFVIAIFNFQMDGFKGLLVDAQFRLKVWSSPHPDIAIIAYDDNSRSRYGDTSRIPVEEIDLVIGALLEEQPMALTMVTSVNDRTYSLKELSQISESLLKMSLTVIAYTDDENLGQPPHEIVAKSARFFPGFISRDNFSYGADSVSRRVMVTINGIPTAYAELARLYHNLKNLPEFRHTHRHGDHGNSLQAYIFWQGGPGTYRIFSSKDVAERRFVPGTFRNKIVLFGTRLEERKVADTILTPYARNLSKTSMLEGAAHGLATLMNDDAVLKSPTWFNILLSLVIAVVTVNMVLFLSPGKGIIFVLSESIALFLLSWIGLIAFHLWSDLAHPLVVAAFGYYLVIPYRLFDEYKKRWHYQEKSEMMAQLEQLKTNFLSLISHDLKTPIARIQGNAELLLHDSSILENKLRKSASAIVQTAEDLTQYVETILDLTRIESARLPVTKTSRDINSVVTEVVESRQFMATEKNIELKMELEPMFSFRFDAKLIKRVLSNLIENAIKYSPENSAIHLTSREEGNWVKIAVSDQGFGIPSEDHDKIFTKFYRCNNSSTKAIKGTGLGLYLVKYFIELHQGIVELRSEVGKGSTFTVCLPV